MIEKRIGELVCRNLYFVFLDSLPLWSTWNYQMLQIFIVLPSFHELHFNFIKRWGAGNNWLVKKVVWNQQFSYHYNAPPHHHLPPWLLYISTVCAIFKSSQSPLKYKWMLNLRFLLSIPVLLKQYHLLKHLACFQKCTQITRRLKSNTLLADLRSDSFEFPQLHQLPPGVFTDIIFILRWIFSASSLTSWKRKQNCIHPSIFWGLS